VSRWRDGAFEARVESSNASQSVWFALEPEEPGDVVWEGLLVESIGPERVVVAAVPAFAYDVNLGDEVRVMASAEGALVAVGVVRDAGRFTFRVWFPEWERSSADERWKDLQVDLERFECWFDVYSPQLIAVSVEADDAQAVADFLDHKERAGMLQYETGRRRSPSTDQVREVQA
jgi:hypothetical protein